MTQPNCSIHELGWYAGDLYRSLLIAVGCRLHTESVTVNREAILPIYGLFLDHSMVAPGIPFKTTIQP